jgi:hypothetical protein
MPCVPFEKDGMRGFVCGPRQKPKPCPCGSGKPATQLCDGQVEGGTCDKPLCKACTTSPEAGKDFCPDHAPAAPVKAAKAKRASVPMVDPICAECSSMAEQVDSAVIYPHRPDLHGKPMFRCACGAYVGAHPGTDVPLGYPAGPETRQLRSKVHRLLDPLWEAKMQRDKVSKGKARDAAYGWLAGQLGIPRDDCHVSHFNADRCRAAIAILEPFRRR